MRFVGLFNHKRLKETIGVRGKNMPIIRGENVDIEKLKRAKELRHSMTPAEKLLWEKLRANRLEGFHFRRQQVIEGFIVDFYCHQAKLVVEVDGEIHHQLKDRDNARDELLRSKCLTILRFTNSEIEQSPTEVIGYILEACLKNTTENPGYSSLSGKSER
jgi:very-short-patch-repair endonuclease